ncbi:50S ribosomal protein L11 methyltransferase [Heliorestis acidaminivorans]|uniref:Ribosomal protein L11 methyltransferase n=1 Tax=Heliorestis acidaminivorans TaxID=553427 RepID=A0A6I0EZC2_9FIRM|nr:50S ribosomal protein L11 methyltransferase [Heliorestis acidaminivorans]KAB2952289.1 50S ribosomal protein L11 methyltransferase [Heliorestis acidaminivorans]
MKWRELSITTWQANMDALSDIFESVGAIGMVVEDPQLIADYIASNSWDHYDVEIPDVPPGMVRLKAYLPVDSRLDERLNLLQHELLARENTEGWSGHTVTFNDLLEEDWANAWKAFFKPEKVGQRIVIRPSWEDYEAKDDELVISIDPGMAFGTGNHPTTVMCIRALEDYLNTDELVMDVGTGSGVLAITAALLGASSVKAFDNDPIAVNVARENVAMNELDSIVKVEEKDLLQGVEEESPDIIVANIVADIIIRFLPQAQQILRSGKLLITSGIIQHRLDEVVEKLTDHNFIVEELISHGEWAAIVARRE